MSYSTVAGLGILLAGLVLALWWIRRREAQAASATELAARGEDAARKAVAHAQVADVRGRDLGREPGLELRPSDKPVRE